MTENPLTAEQLLQEALDACNVLVRQAYEGVLFKDTYQLAAAIEQWKERHNRFCQGAEGQLRPLIGLTIGEAVQKVRSMQLVTADHLAHEFYHEGEPSRRDLISALDALVSDLQDCGDDRNPETGKEYESVAAAREMLSRLREPQEGTPR